jgi:hypothetical protein
MAGSKAADLIRDLIRRVKTVATLAELAAMNTSNRKAILEAKPKPKANLNGRRYTVIGHRLNGEDIVKHNLSATKANSLRASLRKEGCHAVDKIETVSYIPTQDGERKLLTFSEKAYTPILEGKVPGNAVATELRIAAQRNTMKARNIEKIRRASKSTETRNEAGNVIIYDKMSGRAIFYGTEAEAVFYLINNNLDLVNLVIYMGSKTYRKVMAK